LAGRLDSSEGAERWQGTVQFRILGPLEVLDGQHLVELGRPKQRALLAVLLVHANQVVALDRLIEELSGVEVSVWGHTVALIGGTFEMAIGREAVLMLLRGSEHKTVYRFLERKRADIKVYQMGF